MPIQEPQSMDDLIYFTKRAIGEGSARAWVYKEKCPQCKKGVMGKPVDAKTGRAKIRAKEYVCPECAYTADKDAYEDTLTAQVAYVCPHCKAAGDAEVSFKRRKVSRFDEEKQKKVVVEVLRVQCHKCGGNIDVTKKMK